jgi:hypothetical protein
MFRRPLFWILFVLASIGCTWFAARYFSQAFPIVSLDIGIDRATALVRARELAEKHQFGPSGFAQAASFRGDQQVQNFVELEAGGADAFRTLLVSGLNSPYRWVVRHFREGEARETEIWLTPKGDPYGFRMKLPEKEPGAALDAADAQAIAERAATSDWKVKLGEFHLVEKSRDVRPSGRVDHAFVYERPEIRLGEGRYRLRLAVGGDRLTELVPFVKVPEAFSRRYEAMRSSNNVISFAGAVALVILYLIAGCGFGVFYLLRQRWIVWRPPVVWGTIIAFLQLLASINSWPLLWMDYDTAVSARSFMLQQVGLMLLAFLGYALLFSVSFMAAESLSRRAFPRHVQFWKTWSKDVAGTRTLLGQTVTGYLLIGLFFGYEVVLYLFANRRLGWWSPSDTLVQPDVLANYLPWLSSIATSSQAGFWEECLFRAVPIAGAALLGNRFGRRNWWIGAAVVVQALIFGSGHAGYANQPSYARVAELVLPSFMFAGLYLAFGLWPGIVLHYAYDVVWISLPLFVSNARGIWLDRSLVLALVLVPLWVVVTARLRSSSWGRVNDADFNANWRPAETGVRVEAEEKPAPGSIQPTVARYLPLVGLAGIAAWAVLMPFRTDAPQLNLSRSEAERLARQALRDHQVELSPAWKMLPAVQGSPGDADRFIWQTAGPETYRRLLGSYLDEPHWVVRFARFEGDVAERAEEYRVRISAAGRVTRFEHQLAEAAPGASISEAAARELAIAALSERFGLEASQLKEISASPSRLKSRTDWSFRFSDESRQKLPQGDARVAIEIAGDRVVDGYRYVHVPEDWSRKERDRRILLDAIGIGSTVLTVLAAIVGIALAVLAWSRREFSVRSFVILLPAVFLATAAASLNRFPAAASAFSTAQPFQVQTGLIIIGSLLASVVLSAALGLIGGLVAAWRSGSPVPRLSSVLGLGIGLGGLAATVAALFTRFGPRAVPAWADLGALSTWAPIADHLLSPWSAVINRSVIAFFVILAINRLSSGWTRRKLVSLLLLLLAAFAIAGGRAPESVGGWLLAGAIVSVLAIAAYLVVLSVVPEAMLVAVGTVQILALMRNGLSGSYPFSVLFAVVAGISTVAATYVVYRSVVRS